MNNGIQVAARPRYKGHDRRRDLANEPVIKVRSNKRTMSGAETMTPFETMPHRQARIARVSQRRRELRWAWLREREEEPAGFSSVPVRGNVDQYRRLQYSV